MIHLRPFFIVPSDGNKPPTSKRQVALTVDFSLMNAARRILEDSLGVVTGEVVVIICDEARAAIGESLVEVARALGGKAELITLESLGQRPLQTLPTSLRATLAGAQATALIVGTELEPERSFRKELVDRVDELQLRHAHLVGVSRRSVIAGFAVQASRVAEQTRAVRARLRDNSTLQLRSDTGSDLTVKTEARYRWGDQSGMIRPGKWSNLPAGQLFTTTPDINGVFVANASLSSVFAARGLLSASPVSFTIKNGVCRSVSSRDVALAREVDRFLGSVPDLNRVGQVVIGTNPGLTSPLGEFGYDQCVPGLHLSFGWTHPKITGAEWMSAGVLVGNSADGDLDIDGTPIIRKGRFVM